MYIAEIVLEKRDRKPEQGEFDQKVTRMHIAALLDAWRFNGQIVAYGDIAETEQAYLARVWIYEEEGLDPAHNGAQVNKTLEALRKDGIFPRQHTLTGTSLASKEACRCQEHPYFILYHNGLFRDSPLRCGECLLPVPLYRIRSGAERDFSSLIHWQENHDAFFYLFIHSNDSYERHAIEQLSRHNSVLGIQGRECCEDIHAATGVQTYYYLDACEQPERFELCPQCRADWRLPEALHGRFHRGCDVCLLLA